MATRCHLLSLAVIRCNLLYQSLSLVVRLVVSRCYSMCHSFVFFINDLKKIIKDFWKGPKYTFE